MQDIYFMKVDIRSLVAKFDMSENNSIGEMHNLSL